LPSFLSCFNNLAPSALETPYLYTSPNSSYIVYTKDFALEREEVVKISLSALIAFGALETAPTPLSNSSAAGKETPIMVKFW
jgi:hypothetical protein